MRIGIDLGGTKIEGVVLDEKGHVVSRIRVATPQNDYDETLNAIRRLIGRLEADCNISDLGLPVGIATPGAVSALTERMKNCNSTCLNGRPLQEDLQRLLKKDIRLANDADCFTLSEAVDGAGADYQTVFGVILGTGVGGGLVLDKQLLAGPNRIAGEWGHNPMPPLKIPEALKKLTEKRVCYCGRCDCVECWLSGPGFEQSYFELTGQTLSAQQIALKANDESSVAGQLLGFYCESLAAALAVVINILDPGVIVLGGGLSNIDALYKRVPQYWSRYVFTDRCVTKLLSAQYGDSSGVRGAAWLW